MNQKKKNTDIIKQHDSSSSATEMTEFDAIKINLEGRNLVEASAGTGKTYSLALLCLRLLIETEIQLKNILMVTFTNAAVIELEERVRLFIKEAKKAAEFKDINDKTIEQLVHHNDKEKNLNRIKEKLQLAIDQLDETSVYTIHGFCNNTLTEFAFETGQMYETQSMKDDTELNEDCVNEIWREKFTSLDLNLLNHIHGKIERSELIKHIKTIRSGKEILLPKNLIVGLLHSKNEQKKTSEEIENIQEDQKKCKIEFVETFQTTKKEVVKIINENPEVSELFSETLEDSELFFNAFILQHLRNDSLLNTLLIELNNIASQFVSKLDNEKKIHHRIKFSLYSDAYPLILSSIERFKKEKNLITYDDMIGNVHKAITHNPSTALIEGLREKYQAVFLDEFQDTDKLQYEIFDTIFHKPHLMFFIGDPKQSIYAFRRADIFTYFKAAQSADSKYSMQTNFRSSENFIEAMNEFFVPEKDFDTFLFNKTETPLNYQKVFSPKPNSKGKLHYKNEELIPISMLVHSSKKNITHELVTIVSEILSDKDYCIITSKGSRPVRPSDIGILVRKNAIGQEIKNKLLKIGVPAINIDETTILESKEAQELLYVIEAIHEISNSKINQALYTELTNYSRSKVLNLNQEELVNKFRIYQKKWENLGINASLRTFINDFEVIPRLMKLKKEGERKLSNIFQLIELFQKTESQKNYNEKDFISWLKKAIYNQEGNNTDDDYTQRLESDEESVKIITIHKSKGLEYNIVFAPDLDMNISNNHKDATFRDPKEEKYFYGLKEDFSQEQYKYFETQTHQENRRLLYVALTRAVYKTFIFKSTHHSTKDSALQAFYQTLKKTKRSGIEFLAGTLTPPIEYKTSNWKAFTPRKIEKFEIQDLNWKKISYSAISQPNEKSLKSNASSILNEYDNFVFKKLPKGNLTGNLLHLIFENISFSNEKEHKEQIQKILNKFNPNLLEFENEILQLVRETLNCKLRIGKNLISLNQITDSKRLNELEFDFLVQDTDLSKLQALGNEERKISVKNLGEIKGWMNGKIDLFFEHEEKYYILDWKSNYLGDEINHYERENVKMAMNESNYHLQYMIYSLAASKFLSERISGFNYENQFGGVIYLFLRGIRQNKDTGIFSYLPSREEIKKIEEILFSKN